MQPPIAEHNALLIRYMIVFLAGYVLLTIHTGMDIRKKTDAGDPVRQIEPGTARLVDLASLPPQFPESADGRTQPLEGVAAAPGRND